MNTNEINMGTPMIVKLDSLVAGRNPRVHFDEGEMAELVESIRASGVAQPILVRPLPDGTFRIIAGERRVRAARIVFGQEGSIPALARDCDDDVEDVLSLIENVDRAAMSGAEEAEAAHRLLVRAKGDKDEVAAQLGWTMTKLNRRLGLMMLTAECRKALTERAISLGHAELLASVPQNKQNGALEKIIAHNLPVADLRRQVAAMANELTAACFDTADCAQCPYNSAQQRALFSEVVQAGVCTNPSCFEEKTQGKLNTMATELAEEVPKVVILKADSAEHPVRIIKEGKGAVGATQFEACKGCANYGASISALPGSVGEVERGLCFDTACNLKMVSAHIKAAGQKGAAAPAKAGAASTSKAVFNSAGGGKAKATATACVVSTKVKEYRVDAWRKIAAKVTFAQPEVALRMLVSLAMSGYSRHIDANKLKEVFQAVAGVETKGLLSHSLKGASEVVGQASMDAVHKMLSAMAASAFKEIEESKLREALNILAVDLGAHWKLNAEFLNLLTKSELEALANEVGLAQAMGAEGLKKALAQKKPDAIAALLAVDGFVYAGVVPKCMKFDQHESASVVHAVADADVDDDLEGSGDDQGEVQADEQEQLLAA